MICNDRAFPHGKFFLINRLKLMLGTCCCTPIYETASPPGAQLEYATSWSAREKHARETHTTREKHTHVKNTRHPSSSGHAYSTLDLHRGFCYHSTDYNTLLTSIISFLGVCLLFNTICCHTMATKSTVGIEVFNKMLLKHRSLCITYHKITIELPKLIIVITT